MEGPSSPIDKGDPASPHEGELTREKLITKCSTLLQIAKKAKMARDEALTDLTNYQKEVLHANEQLKHKDKQYTIATEMLAALTDQKLKLAMDIDDLKKEKAKNLEDIKNLIELKDKAECEAESYKRQYNRLLDENDELLSELQKKTDSENRLSADIAKLHENNENVKVLFKNVSTEKLDLEKSLETLSNQVASLNREKEELWSVVKENFGAVDLESLLKYVNERQFHDRDQSEVAELRERVRKLSAELDAANADRDETMNNLEELRLETKHLIDNSDKLTEDLEIVKNEKMRVESHLNSVISTLNLEMAEMRDQLVQIGGREVEMSNCADKLSALESENELLQSELKCFKSIWHTIEDSLKVLSSDFDSEMFNCSLEKGVKEVHKVVQRVQKEISTSIGHKEELEGQLAKVSREAKDLEVKMRELQVNNDKLGSLTSGVSSDLDEIQKKYSISRKNEDDLKTKLEQTIEELNQTRKFSNHEIVGLTTRLNDVSLELQKVKEQFEMTRKELIDQLNEKSKECESASSELKTLNESHINCWLEIKNRDSELAQAEKEIRRLSERNSELDKMSADFNEATTELKSLEFKYSELLKSEENGKKLLEETETAFRKKTDEFESLSMDLKVLKDSYNEQLVRVDSLQVENKELEESKNQLKTELDAARQEMDSVSEEFENRTVEIANLNKHIAELKEELTKKTSHTDELVKKEVNEYREMVQFKTKELEEVNRIWAGRLNSVKIGMMGLRKGLAEVGLQWQDQLRVFTDDIYCLNEIFKETVQSVVNHSINNTKKELLSEMHIMNEALRERGESLSKLQEAISELKGKYEKETNLNEKLTHELKELRSREKLQEEKLLNQQLLIRDLESELMRLRELKDASADADGLSTSTISRTEEHNQLREADECIEDKYVKLRHIAVKLKRRVAELNQNLDAEKTKAISEKTEFLDKIQQLSGVAKNAQRVQESYDKVLDELEEVKKENSVLKSTLKDWKKTEESLLSQITSLESTNHSVPLMRKQIDSLNGVIKELKSDIQKLEMEKKVEVMKYEESKKAVSNLEGKVQNLTQSLDQAIQQGRSSNVLVLEMKNYEKVVADLTTQLNNEKSRTGNLESENLAITNLKEGLEEQLAILEKTLKDEEQKNLELKENIAGLREKNETLSNSNGELLNQISELRKDLQAVKDKCELQVVEMSSLSRDFNKKELEAQERIEFLKSHVQSLETNLASTKHDLSTSISEMEHLREEFESYRVRAQNTLAKQKTDSVSQSEKEAKEQVYHLNKQIEALRLKLEASLSDIETFNNKLDSLQMEKNRSDKRYEDVKKTLHQKINDYDSLNAEYRAFKISTGNSVQSLEMDLEQKEKKYKMELSLLKDEVEDLRNQLELKEINENNSNDVSPVLQSIDANVLQEREDGEGSEGSTPPILSRGHHLTPLDVLLNSPIDDENRVPRLLEQLEKYQKEISSYELRTKHLSSLLNEAEKDAARSSHQNAILKEELRRLERSLERQPHVANSEYLKNVVFKFLTLQHGDEKSRLVPVLDTILKLSPEETNKLNMVAKGDVAGWSSYLHSWTGL